jgi:hypothetical protein
MSSPTVVKIPISTQYGWLGYADPACVRHLANAPNARFIRRKSDGRLLRIVLDSHGDDYARLARAGNPQSDIHHAETDTNPPRVWAFKRHCGERASEPQP